MAVVTLPTSPGPRAVRFAPVDFGGTQTGVLGGSSQRVNRLGNRWRCEVAMPAMTPADARKWAAALTRGLRNGVSWKIRQVGTPVGPIGSPLVAGADQAGDSLDIDTATAGVWLRAGQWLSITTASVAYLYQVAQDVRVADAGTATVEIEPPLRVTPADNDPVNIAAPVIEGLLAVPFEWGIDANRLVNGFSFTIEEQR